MARVAFLLPRQDMLAYIPTLARKYQLDIAAARAIQTFETLEATRQVMEDGADIVVARGVQAGLIKRHTSVPLVTIRFTAQEIGLLVEQARTLTGKPSPTVALVGFSNMFQDISHMGELMGVRLLTFFPEQEELLVEAAEQALASGADALIGGDIVCQYAAQRGVPAVFISASAECIEIACRDAQRLAYALDMEKRNTAELQAIMDYTVNGLIRIDGNCLVRQLNLSSEHLLDISQQTAAGRPVWELLPDLTAEVLSPVLRQGQELPALHLRQGKARFMATVSPVTLEGRSGGAVISITDSQQLQFYAERQRRELSRQGFAAPFTFDTLIARSPEMQALLETARRYARFSAPVVIQGESGTEKEELAQCIHNAGDSPESAFLSFNCGSLEPAAAEERLFGPQGLLRQTLGTVFLEDIACLSSSAQYMLYRLISGQPYPGGGLPTGGPLRVLVGTRGDLQDAVREKALREDLYYAVSVAALHIPPLRERREDVVSWAEYFLRSYQERYGRYVHLTRTAWQRVRDYAWPGNLSQLRNVCQRIIVGAPRRSVDEFFLDEQLQRSAASAAPPPSALPAPPQDPNAARIVELLASCHGSRAAVARALGISTTTLWRRMKKYGIRG